MIRHRGRMWKTLENHTKMGLKLCLSFVTIRLEFICPLQNEDVIPKRAGHPDFTMVRKGSRVQISKAAPEFRNLNRSVSNRAVFCISQRGYLPSPKVILPQDT